MTLHLLARPEGPPLAIVPAREREAPRGREAAPARGRFVADMLSIGTTRVPSQPDSAAQHRALVEAASAGDRRAAAELMQALLPRVRNLVRYLMRGDADVDDLAQESLVTILRGLPSYRGEGTVTAWSDRIVARTVFAHLRRSRANEKCHVEYTPDLVPIPPGESAHGFLARRRVVRALDELPAEQRIVLVLHHAMGLSVREIAEELEVAFETVRSRMRLGMARLRNAVAGDDEPEVRSS